ncbi:MAG: hypothetical protein WBW93_20055 [Steroidobacteraceae bacterium]
MNCQKPKRMVFALVLAMPLASSLASAMTVSQNSLSPWGTFLRSLHVKKGVYYLVSPEIIETPPLASSIGDIDAKNRRLELRAGYVIIYGESEKIADRIELAKHNMALISRELAASPAKLDPKPLMAGGILSLGDQYKIANYACRLHAVNVPPSGVTGAMIGDGLSATRVCVGFGIIAGLAGYKMMPGEHALELQRVIDVMQGALIGRGRAPGSRHPSHMPPVTGGQKQQPT